MRDELESVCAAFRLSPPGLRLRKMREAVGCSQKQLADWCRVPQSTISRMESGADGRLSTWIAVLEALGASLIFRFRDEDWVDEMGDDALRRKDRKLSGLKQFAPYASRPGLLWDPEKGQH